MNRIYLSIRTAVLVGMAFVLIGCSAAAPQAEPQGGAPAAQQPASQQPFGDESAALVEPAAGQPDTAVLQSQAGLVEIQHSGEGWQPVVFRQTAGAGDRLRTARLSAAEFQLPGGSLVRLGPDAELTIDSLQGGAELLRVVELTQVRGQSEHIVTPAAEEGARYAVQAAGALGTAHGTAFRVRVTDTGGQFAVTEGLVVVSAADTSVDVNAGQVTSVTADEPPAVPVVFLNLQGVVDQVGQTWSVDGLPLQTHPETVITGDPQVGDIVLVEGRVLEDGAQVADLILLLRRSPVNTFRISGEITSQNETEWVISGQVVQVGTETVLDAGLTVGATVLAEGLVLSDGSLRAQTIRRVAEPAGHPFQFSGPVQEMGEGMWLVAGVNLVVTPQTIVEDGLAVGQVVTVSGLVLEDAVWQASEISLAGAQQPDFEFSGLVEGTAPWQVAGIQFLTDEWTVMPGDLAVGEHVRVQGSVQANGAWLAALVERFEDEIEQPVVVFIGTVISIDPWVVSGAALSVTPQTVIIEPIRPGMVVRVEVAVQADGTWQALRIEKLKGAKWPGECTIVTAKVVLVNGAELQLEGYAALPLTPDTAIQGELAPDRTIQVQICTSEEGELSVVTIVVLAEDEIPTGEGTDQADKVDVCHKPDDKNGGHTINIASSALPAHLAHGDYQGSCTQPVQKDKPKK